MQATPFRTYVEEHPRMLGALFTLLVLLSQAQATLAAGATYHNGP